MTTQAAGLRALQRRISLALALACTLLQPAQRVQACGYEDPASIALGSLNFTYPNALYVGTAIWQARQAGLLPAAVPPPSGADAALQAGQDGRLQAMQALYQLRRHLGNEASLPPLSVVFTPAVMWSRLTPQPDKLLLKMHVAGPEADDVVLITEPAALQAWISKKLTTQQLLDNGLIRLYGDDERVGRIREAFFRAEAFRSEPVSAVTVVNRS